MLIVSSVTHIYGTNIMETIAGGKAENTFWRAENLTLPSGIVYAVIKFGSNNISYNEVSKIAHINYCDQVNSWKNL